MGVIGLVGLGGWDWVLGGWVGLGEWDWVLRVW